MKPLSLEIRFHIFSVPVHSLKIMLVNRIRFWQNDNDLLFWIL